MHPTSTTSTTSTTTSTSPSATAGMTTLTDPNQGAAAIKVAQHTFATAAAAATTSSSASGSSGPGPQQWSKMDKHLMHALTESIIGSWSTPVPTRYVHPRTGETLTATGVRRALTNKPCLECQTVAAKTRCSGQLCRTCCFKINVPCKVHRTPAWREVLLSIERERKRLLRVQRGYCKFFMAGKCTKGQSCEFDHGANDYLASPSIRNNFASPSPASAASSEPHAKLKFSLTILPAASVGDFDMEKGDKVKLPPSVLMFSLQKELSMPMAFQISRQVSAGAPPEPAAAHCGVLSFTSQEGTAVVPTWMFQQLGAQENELVSFSYTQLPKGTFCVLQPLSTSWLFVPFQQRQSVLERHLRNFQTLAQGALLSVQHQHATHQLRVLECKPASVVSIIDTDITTDVVEPASGTLSGPVLLSRDAAPTPSSLKKGSSQFFMLHPPSENSGRGSSTLALRLTCVSGDADLYVSQTHIQPSQACYAWCAQEPGDKVLVLGEATGAEDEKENACQQQQQEAEASNGPSGKNAPDAFQPPRFDPKDVLYVSVHALQSDAVFSIAVFSETDKATRDRGQRLTGAAVSTAVGEQQSKKTHAACSNCGKSFLPTTLVMHERNCARHTFRCSVGGCKQAMPIAWRDKHALVAHTPLTCQCGLVAEQAELHHHQHSNCPLRLVSCDNHWCRTKLPLADLAPHQAQCSASTLACPACAESVAWSMIDYHFEALHCVPCGTLDWSAPLEPQLSTLSIPVVKASKRGASRTRAAGGDSNDSGDDTTETSLFDDEHVYVCDCGDGFDMLDDYQVHQLTDCSLNSRD